MDRESIISYLIGKDTKDSYQGFIDMLKCLKDDKSIIAYFADYLSFLTSTKASVRLRSFMLICNCAPFDDEQIIYQNRGKIFSILNDDKPTIVRQAIALLAQLVKEEPILRDFLEHKLSSLDLAKYKDSMSPLIKKDIELFYASLAF